MYRLEQNFRSSKCILDCSNALIIKSPRIQSGKTGAIDMGFEKPSYIPSLSQTSDNEDGERVSVREFESAEAESAWVIDMARVARRKVGILYRTSYQGRILEQKLIERQIPYEMVGREGGRGGLWLKRLETVKEHAAIRKSNGVTGVGATSVINARAKCDLYYFFFVLLQKQGWW
jgi:superfamily I DNA/RNA helicase